MAPRNREEANNILSQIAQRDSELRLEDTSFSTYISKAEWFVKYAWLFGAVVASVTIWVAKVQWDSHSQASDIAKLTSYCELAKDQWVTDQALIISIQNTIIANRTERMADVKSLRDDVATLKLDTPKVAEIWFMKIHGISNKENYMRETGQSARDYPTKPEN